MDKITVRERDLMAKVAKLESELKDLEEPEKVCNHMLKSYKRYRIYKDMCCGGFWFLFCYLLSNFFGV
jgi:hypothetical protein